MDSTDGNITKIIVVNPKSDEILSYTGDFNIINTIVANSNIMIAGEWTKGKKSGYLKEYYSDGSLRSEKNFSNGILDTSTVKEYKETVKFTGTEPEETAPIFHQSNICLCPYHTEIRLQSDQAEVSGTSNTITL